MVFSHKIVGIRVRSMDTNTPSARGADEILSQMYFNETVQIEIEYKKKALAAERRHLEEERQKLKKDKRDFDRYRKLERQKLDQSRRLFDNKWRILEEETRKLANERIKVEQQKAFYEQVKRTLTEIDDHKIIEGDMFFIGVNNEGSLKRRYRDLLKIYHPDNIGGDTHTIQEINREYDCLKQRFA